MQTIPVHELAATVGEELGPSEWLRIDQQRIDRFAVATSDHQFIHVDPQRAAATVFGGTIAHGFLVLSLASRFLAEIARVPAGMVMALNYGSDRVRFLNAVKVGSRVRASAAVLEVREKHPHQWLIRHRVSVQIEDEKLPALVADVLVLFVLDPAHGMAAGGAA